MNYPRVIRISDILDQIQSYLPGANTHLVEKAYVFAAKAHAGQVRKSGEPYLSHPLAVAYILARMRLDLPTIAAGLLHDTVEDSAVTLEEIRRHFGPEVALIVDGVTKLSALPKASRLERQAENYRKMLLSMAQDLRVILVKLADRLHNMRTLEFQPEEKRRRIAQETLDIYAPLASRLGIDWLKQELEDLSFQYLYPEEFRRLKAEVEKRVEAAQDYVEEVKRIIREELAKHGIEARVLGRTKHLWSVYRKLERYGLTIDQLDQIYDLIGFRVIVKTVSQCYQVLGILHALWPPIPGRFKDYISVPKPNLYQSLHTTVMGPGGKRIEIQIRTEEMDRIANEGIAAHWLYKEGTVLAPGQGRKFEWLERLVELQKELQNPREFLESLRLDLFPEEVYVFTPRGDIKVLPRGATPVDFAYAIHTEVGNHCVRAWVNDRLVPLDYELQTGDVVRIETSPTQKPSRDWLKFVKTSRARSRIRQWLRQEEREQALALGREVLSREFRKHRRNFADFIDSPAAEEVARSFNFKNVEEMIAAVGYGKLTPQQVLRRAFPDQRPAPPARPAGERGAEAVEYRMRSEVLSVDGMRDVLFHLSRCCHPVPGDEVVGYITRGRGISVHRVDCPNVALLDEERKIEVRWEKTDGAVHPVRLSVLTQDRKGMLAEVSGAITAAEANILKAEVDTTPDRRAVFDIVVEVTDRNHLERIMANLRSVKGVLRVRRRFS
ncbi:bifunctional (p)ppGpp synthetase/guanosine-3',5'-bis(diphosphate) 3'-pyrophosphohydrolase [Thermosulfurimonas marina]|uniref:Bifunctional (P)ppGpp synthetase/guanosine-3',5'-bis(Diphosphate) 3'-pyrophosphohydrolase n=1 Tax=Thermosulfurimonas marina TaxID=2047767 RepID=A0A6H1WST2_9BACT|nr:bifunctional (p)ppGpp synthetase/guanosine-3',5'-bis(diphosphate) 3'-pyrophosphohydrolase [Thermosulfurimonas marina]QJA06186.1 bifunctional (p)ppGpp synthetase/guanosine-3',5'-bis(diphosphate) 3'-pyrophosphohydrolase [Thermosulfurimonas marina]